MELDVAMALGADRITRSFGEQPAISLFRAYVGETPYMVNLRRLLKFLQITDGFSRRHPCGGIALRLWSRERFDAFCRPYEQNPFSCLWNTEIRRPVKIIVYVITQVSKIRQHLLKPFLVTEQRLHIFGDKNFRLNPPNRFDHRFIQSASRPIDTSPFAID